MLTVTHALIDYWKRLPFEPPAARRRRLDTLIERIRALPNTGDIPVAVYSGAEFDTPAQRRLTLGPTEFRLLHFFMTHPERVYSREQLQKEGTRIQAEWGVVGCLATVEPEEIPMAPITMTHKGMVTAPETPPPCATETMAESGPMALATSLAPCCRAMCRKIPKPRSHGS